MRRQPVNSLAIVYTTCEIAGATLETEISEVDLLKADMRTAMEEFTEAQQHQERMQGKLKDFQVCLDNAFASFKEANLEDARKRTTETKPKADDAHDRVRTRRDRCRRATEELETAADLDDSPGRVD